ncbi:MAG: hypothetical protein ACYDDS_16225 [Candidatus Sulfotelmatobacter sp.]
MNRVGRISIAVLGSIVALPIGFILGFYLVLLFDHNYHDGVSAVGGFVVAVIASVVTLRFLWKRQPLHASSPGKGQ